MLCFPGKAPCKQATRSVTKSLFTPSGQHLRLAVTKSEVIWKSNIPNWKKGGTVKIYNKYIRRENSKCGIPVIIHSQNMWRALTGYILCKPRKQEITPAAAGGGDTKRN